MKKLSNAITHGSILKDLVSPDWLGFSHFRKVFWVASVVDHLSDETLVGEHMAALFFLIFLGVVAFGVAVMMISSYNGLVSLKNQIERAWSNIDVILKQRSDEIPQLIQVIEQYAGYESGLLKNLAETRSQYGRAQDVGQKIKASQEMSLALQGVIAIGEAYPALKANENFVQLQSRVSGLESMISDRRESYNEAVTNFNTRILQFPDVFAARMLNYSHQELFHANDAERLAPNLKINLPSFKLGA